MKERRPRKGVCCKLFGSLLGFRAFLIFGGMVRSAGLVFHVGAADVAAWPYSVGMLVKLCAFVGSLHLPAVVHDLGPSGVSNVEMLILHERWAGERPGLEPTVPRYGRSGRPISVSTVPVGPSIDICRSCGLFGSVLRALYQLPCELGRFSFCRIGANHCRLRGFGWEQYGHGLTSRPREGADVGFLDILVLLGCPAHSLWC